MESRVPLKPGFDTGMFMCAIIIHDQMQVESGWRFAVYFLEETDKFLMPMAWHTIANHLTVEHAEGRKQGGCAVAFVIVRHCPAAALLDGETRLGAVERLDLTLLVDTQNQGLVWRIEIQSNYVAEFLNKVFVAAELEGPDQMWLEVVLLPDPLNGCLAKTLGFGHASRTPVSGVGGCGVQCGLDYRTDFFHRDLGFATRTGRIFFQPRQTQCQKTLSPELNGRSRHPQSFGDSLTEDAVGSHHDDFGPLHQSQGKTSSARPCFHGSAFFWGQHDGRCGFAHYPYNRAYPTYMSSYL